MAETVLAKMAIQIAANTSQFNNALAKSDQNLKKFSGNVLKIGAGLVAGFSLTKIGSDVIDVTAQFQKFEAVLSNTLGSESDAQKALQQIKQFASETPFAVDELTGAFVKLANQGFVPTVDEMRSLGDLASSTGKTFDQLAEAIIDAQTNQFERLKEFGIRAQKQGDQVKFTFKGVATTVDNSSESIKRYILSLGNAVGVSGAMEKISGTLGGRISNLGDAWDNLLVTIGNGNSGVLFGAVKLFTQLANFTTDLFGGDSNPLKSLENGIRILNESGLEGERYADALKEVTKRAQELGIELIKLTDPSTGLSKILIDDRSKPKVINAEEIVKTKGLIEELEEKIKSVQTALPKAFTVPEIRRLQKELEGLQDQMTLLVTPDVSRPLDLLDEQFKKISEDLKPIVIPPPSTEGFEEALKAFQESVRSGFKEIKGTLLEVDLSGLVSNVVSDLAYGLGQAAAGIGNFGDVILSALVGFARQFGEILIGLGIAALAAKKLAVAPQTAIIAGVALVALSGLASAALSKGQSNYNSGSSGGGRSANLTSSGSSFVSRADRIEFDATFKLVGNDLVASVNNTNAQNGRLRGG